MDKSNVKNITTSSDLEELKRSIRFILDHEEENTEYHGNDRDPISSATDNVAVTAARGTAGTKSSWQDRMVAKYHQHLYKTYVMADLSHYDQCRIGLRWRTECEVKDEKGAETCGNKHCPCYWDQNRKKAAMEVKTWRRNIHEHVLLDRYDKKEDTAISTKTTTTKVLDDSEEAAEDWRLKRLPYGIGLRDYEVHFAYVEHGEEKEELVKLRLCLRCAPKLFFGNGGSVGARKAREKKIKGCC